MSDIPTMDVNVTTERHIWTDRRITVAMLVILLAVVGFEAARFQNGLHTRGKVDAASETLAIIKAATSPEAQAKGAAAYAAAVSSINANTQQIASVAIFCARQGGDVPTISKCVDGELAKLRAAP